MRVGDDFIVILRAGGHVVRTLFPVLTEVGGSVYTLLAFTRFDDAIKRIWRRRRHGQADTTHMVFGQASTDFLPICTTIQAAMNARSRTAIDQSPYVTPTLIAGSHDQVRIIWVYHEFVDSGVLINSKNLVPSGPAILCAIEPAIAP